MNEKERETKKFERTKGPNGIITTRFDTEDIMAIGGVIVALIIAIGIFTGVIDAKVGGGILVAICGGYGISLVIKARNQMNEKERETKEIERTTGPNGTTTIRCDTEDIMAIGGVIAALIIAIGIFTGVIDAKVGGGILVAICGGYGISLVIKAKNNSK